MAAEAADLSHPCEFPTPTIPAPDARKALSDEEAADLLAAYQAGESRASLRDRFGISERTLVRYVRRAGVTRPRRKMTPEDVAEATELFHQGMSLKQLGDRYGLNDETIRVRLVEAGVQMRRRGSPSQRARP